MDYLTYLGVKKMPKFALQQVEMVLFKFGILQERFTDFIFPVSLEIECIMLL